MTAIDINILRAAASGGTIQITTSRSTLQVAPDSVRFEVDLTNATFDTAGPAVGANYDPRLSQIYYFWSTGDRGTWVSPQRCLSQWNDKAVHHGPIMSHCYTQPGTYTVSVIAYESSSGKSATASTTVIVADPDTVYAGSATVCINPAGDTDFTWADGITGNDEVNMDGSNDDVNSQPWWGNYNTATSRRFLLKPITWTDPVHFFFDTGVVITHPYFGSIGAGAVIPVTVTEANRRLVQVGENYSAGPGQDIRMVNLTGTGTFNPAAEIVDDASAASKASSVIRCNYAGDIVVHNCHGTGLKNSNFAFYTTPAAGGAGVTSYVHMDDCSALNFGGQYGGMFSENADDQVESWFSMTGVRLDMASDGIHTAGGGPGGDTGHRAPCRENGVTRLVMRCCESYGTDQSNSGWKLMTSPETPNAGHVYSIDGLLMEGTGWLLHFGQNLASSLGNSFDVAAIVVDRYYLAGDFNADSMVETNVTGVELRNGIHYNPNIVRFSDELLSPALITDEENATAPVVDYGPKALKAMGISWNGKGTTSAEIQAAPLAMLNCTTVNNRLIVGNNNNTNGKFVNRTGGGGADFNYTAGLTDTNNVWQGSIAELISAGNETPDAPLTSAELMASLNTGFIGYQTKTPYAASATPGGILQDLKPDTGSSALGNATNAALWDITGKFRPVTGADRGAWQVS